MTDDDELQERAMVIRSAIQRAIKGETPTSATAVVAALASVAGDLLASIEAAGGGDVSRQFIDAMLEVRAIARREGTRMRCDGRSMLPRGSA